MTTIDPDIVVQKFELRKELHEALQERANMFVEAIFKYVESTTRITVAVYCRPECRFCMLERIGEPLFNHINNQIYTHITEDHDMNQFMRQVVIFCKEWVEKRMKQPCTLENEMSAVKEMLQL